MLFTLSNVSQNIRPATIRFKDTEGNYRGWLLAYTQPKAGDHWIDSNNEWLWKVIDVGPVDSTSAPSFIEVTIEQSVKL